MKALSAIERALLTACGSILSPRGARGSLLVLMYHRVLAQPDPLLADEPDAATFAAHMDLVRDTFTVLGLSEAIERLERDSLPRRAVCITFDDGYANNFDVALPILAQRRLPATVFVSTEFIAGGMMWNDMVIEVVRRATGELDLERFGLGRHAVTDMAARRASLDAILRQVKYIEPAARLRLVHELAQAAGIELPRNVMMNEAQVRGLEQAGVEIGSHTHSHPILTKLSVDDARREIAASRAVLQDVSGGAVNTFAYPNGRPSIDYDRQHVAMVRDAGYRAAVSTAWGCARRGTDVYQVPRIAPWDRTARRFAARMVRTYVQGAPQTV